MVQTVIGVIVNAISAASAAFAAYYWYESTTVKIRPESRPGGTGNPDMIVDGYLFVESAKQQSVYNRHAAAAATVAALFQAASENQWGQTRLIFEGLLVQNV